jgi:hypothetical protein
MTSTAECLTIGVEDAGHEDVPPSGRSCKPPGMRMTVSSVAIKSDSAADILWTVPCSPSDVVTESSTSGKLDVVRVGVRTIGSETTSPEEQLEQLEKGKGK